MAHLVWDWNGTLLNDLDLIVRCTNLAFASVGGPEVTADEHRRDFRRPVIAYYAAALGRELTDEEFADLDKVFHEAYRTQLATVGLTTDAREAIAAWPGTQSLLSMWFHEELLPAVTRHRLHEAFSRVDGLRDRSIGDHKASHLAAHLRALTVDPADAVLIGDSVDDADAAASVGARCVLYSGGFTDPDRLRATGLPVADSLVEAVTLARTEGR